MKNIWRIYSLRNKAYYTIHISSLKRDKFCFDFKCFITTCYFYVLLCPKTKFLGFFCELTRAGLGISGSRVPKNFSGTRTQNWVRVPENIASWVESIINQTCKRWVTKGRSMAVTKSFYDMSYEVSGTVVICWKAMSNYRISSTYLSVIHPTGFQFSSVSSTSVYGI